MIKLSLLYIFILLMALVFWRGRRIIRGNIKWSKQ